MSRTQIVVAVAAVLLAVALIGLLSSSADSSAPIDNLTGELVGQKYRFHFRYPGEDGALHTDDDRFGSRNLYVPEDAVIQLRLNSSDYIYTVEIPELDVYEVAVPDLTFDVQFVAKPVGSHDLLGSQMCGYDHSDLLGKLIVQSPSEFRRTMARLSKNPTTSQKEPVE